MNLHLSHSVWLHLSHTLLSGSVTLSLLFTRSLLFSSTHTNTHTHRCWLTWVCTTCSFTCTHTQTIETHFLAIIRLAYSQNTCTYSNSWTSFFGAIESHSPVCLSCHSKLPTHLCSLSHTHTRALRGGSSAVTYLAGCLCVAGIREFTHWIRRQQARRNIQFWHCESLPPLYCSAFPPFILFLPLLLLTF